jgi:hypothetical protein
MPFSAVQSIFRWLLVGLILATIMLWMRFLNWRPSLTTSVAVLALTLGCFPVAQALLLEQLTIVVSVLVAACLVLLMRERFLLAGILLAIASIKPQLVWPLAVWLCLWSLSDWRKRQRFLWGFVATGMLLAIGGEIVLPGWIIRFHTAVEAYRQYTGTQSVIERLTTPTIGTAINDLLLLMIAIVCWRSRKTLSGSTQFAIVSSLVLATTIVTVSTVAPYNQILLIPAALFLVKDWERLWKADTFVRAACFVGSAFVFWPWLSSVGLLIASIFLPPAIVQKAWWVPIASSLAIPPSVLGLYGLYVRRAM